MRMWMVDPSLLCRKHLLGEHGEIHKFRHSFLKRHNMAGRTGQIFPDRMQERHDELAQEMINRTYNHKSPYEQPDVRYLYGLLTDKVDVDGNLADLSDRCADCKERIEKSSYNEGE